jgi:hypothetical protein
MIGHSPLVLPGPSDQYSDVAPSSERPDVTGHPGGEA